MNLHFMTLIPQTSFLLSKSINHFSTNHTYLLPFAPFHPVLAQYPKLRPLLSAFASKVHFVHHSIWFDLPNMQPCFHLLIVVLINPQGSCTNTARS